MNHFQYKEDTLYCEDVPLSDIAEQVGTPVYIYSHATLTRHLRVFDQALAQALTNIDHIICFSVKANSNLAVLRTLFSEGAGADVVSGGELYRALAAGVDTRKVVFSGVGKTEAELRQGIEAGILAFNVESREELETLDRVAGALGKRAPVSFRINPDVDPQTHPYISTGLEQNKFGIPMTEAREHYRFARDLDNLDIVGVDCHIGSQLTRTEPFTDAARRLVPLIQDLRADGIPLRYLDIGGGLGISYGNQADPEPPEPAAYGAAIQRALGPLADMGLTLICEPGRVIAGNAGILLTRVLYRKRTVTKHFTIVDAAFNDLMRPALYQSYHPMQPVRRGGGDLLTTDVVGPICESSDFLARDRELPALAPGDLLAVGAAGAYGFTMASNYNTRPRAAEVLVKGNRYAVVRKRETLAQLVENETIPDLP